MTAPFMLCRSFWVPRQACHFVLFGTMTGRKLNSSSINEKLEISLQRTEIRNWSELISQRNRLSSSSVSTLVGKEKVFEANTSIFDSKIKEVREARCADLSVEVFSWFNQQQRYSRSWESAACENSFRNSERELYLANIGLTCLFWCWEMCNRVMCFPAVSATPKVYKQDFTVFSRLREQYKYTNIWLLFLINH